MIISHIDHGKSTLADRLLEITGTISKDKMKEQFLDSMALEREKGITIKMHPVRLNYQAGANSYILNLIDTPGHIDFSYEISRALACVEGALLLVDAVKGIQAQTLHNLNQAQKQGLVIIGAVNKIDLPQARVEQTRQELAEVLNVDLEDIFLISGKTGENVEALLQAVIEKVPCPVVSDINKPLKALVFDSKYDPFSGVVAFVRVFEGKITAGDKITFVRANYQCESKEVGYFIPHLVAAPFLGPGDIGYIKTGIKV
ncbi:MAG: GTP-binding protein, partial [bacterium]|nr:GTP-binding protein [bacterium]